MLVEVGGGAIGYGACGGGIDCGDGAAMTDSTSTNLRIKSIGRDIQIYVIPGVQGVFTNLES